MQITRRKKSCRVPLTAASHLEDPFCVEFARSPCVDVGFLLVLCFPHHQKYVHIVELSCQCPWSKDRLRAGVSPGAA